MCSPWAGNFTSHGVPGASGAVLIVRLARSKLTSAEISYRAAFSISPIF